MPPIRLAGRLNPPLPGAFAGRPSATRSCFSAEPPRARSSSYGSSVLLSGPDDSLTPSARRRFLVDHGRVEGVVLLPDDPLDLPAGPAQKQLHFVRRDEQPVEPGGFELPVAEPKP